MSYLLDFTNQIVQDQESETDVKSLFTRETTEGEAKTKLESEVGVNIFLTKNLQ